MNNNKPFQNTTIFLLIILMTRCSTGQKISAEVTSGLPKHDLEIIVLMGINDFHGALSPHILKTKESLDVAPITYEKGGANILASHINILKSQFGKRFFLLDAGDEFQGSVESNSEEGAPVVQLFNQLEVRAAAIGNHEFDYGPVGPEGSTGDLLGALKERLKQAHYPYLAANINDRDTGKLTALPNTFPSYLTQVGRLKIGVIGLSTTETPKTTRPDQIRSLVFTDLKEAVLRETKNLRAQGAQIIVLTAHVGLVCAGGKMSNAHIFRKSTDPQGECVQKKNSRESEMTDLLMSLPPNTVDAALSGHSHTIIHHWINDIPVIQGGARNQYYNLIYLTYDFTENKFLRDRTRIEGPVPICPKVFANQGNCDGDELPPVQGRGNLITPTFHGKLVLPDETTETSLKPLFEKYAPIINRAIGHAARPVDHDRKKESEMGNLVTDVIRKKVKADVALFNPGGIRDGLNAGAITFGKLYSILPFENAISVLKLTGKELKLLIRIAENGTRGYFPVSGLKLKLIHLDQDAPSSDINNDGHIEPWEINRILDIRLENGEKIQDSKFYSLATVDFLVTGGDDMEWIMSQIPPDRIQFDAGGLIRNAVIDFIATNGPLNTVTHPLVDPGNPRFIIVKTHSAKKRKTK